MLNVEQSDLQYLVNMICIRLIFYDNKGFDNSTQCYTLDRNICPKPVKDNSTDSSALFQSES